MVLDIKESTNNFRKDSKIYATYFGFIAFILILYYFTGLRIYSNIGKILQDTKSVNREIQILTTKVDSLKSIDSTSFANISALTNAFPSEEPTLFMYTQLKQIAAESGVLINNIIFSSASQATGSISQSKLGFTLIGSRSGLFNFITVLSESAPVSGLGEITIKDFAFGAGLYFVDLSLDLYYSDLPKTLPETNKIVDALSSEEQKTYEYLSKLKVYGLSEIKPSASNQDNINPFTTNTVVILQDAESEVP